MEELDIKKILTIFAHKVHYIIIIVSIFVILGFIYSFKFVEPKYKAYTTLILTKINSSIDTERYNEEITQTDLNMNSKLVSTYRELIKSYSLLQTVKENLNIDIEQDVLKNMISVKTISDTELIEISVVSEDSEYSAIIANEIAKVFSVKVEEVYSINNIYIVDKATAPEEPYNINHVKNIAIFTVIGFIAATAYVLLYTTLDTTIRTISDIERGVRTIYFNLNSSFEKR